MPPGRNRMQMYVYGTSSIRLCDDVMALPTATCSQWRSTSLCSFGANLLALKTHQSPNLWNFSRVRIGGKGCRAFGVLGPLLLGSKNGTTNYRVQKWRLSLESWDLRYTDLEFVIHLRIPKKPLTSWMSFQALILLKDKGSHCTVVKLGGGPAIVRPHHAS